MMIKKMFRLLFSRIAIVSLIILLQLVILFVWALGFSEYFVYYYLLSFVISMAMTIHIVNRRVAAEYNIAWLITVLSFPVFGTLLYVIFSGNRLSERKKRQMAGIASAMYETLCADNKQNAEEMDDAGAIYQSRYMSYVTRFPLYKNTEVQYFSLGDDMFPRFIDELWKAEKYIFLEYFIIAEGKMWTEILAVLQEKVKQGVDVRVIYEDMGCITLLPSNYPQKLESMGIRCRVFNRFVPVLSARLNNRDHRKIGVIDGKTAFTGGVNLSDEYINETVRFGHWKDNAVMLHGEAAWSMTVMFLTMWDYLESGITASATYEHYKPNWGTDTPVKADGWVQPYTDTPLDDEAVGETIYLNMIRRAEKYIWITTPYLIIDEVLESELCGAAKNGIDVRIITPGIADKLLVYEVTKSHYDRLIRSGVRIYEYTPGFIHAKTFLCDGKYATVGTVNLDFRSLYLHFECGVWMYRTEAVRSITEDFDSLFTQCLQIHAEDCAQGFIRKWFRAILAMFAPLL